MTVLPSFTRSIDSLFRKLGMAATYQPALGAALAVAVIPKRPDAIIGLNETRLMAETTLFDVRVSEVEQPQEGDAIEYDGTQYRIIGEPRRDIHRLVWMVEAQAV